MRYSCMCSCRRSLAHMDVHAERQMLRAYKPNITGFTITFLLLHKLCITNSCLRWQPLNLFHCDLISQECFRGGEDPTLAHPISGAFVWRLECQLNAELFTWLSYFPNISGQRNSTRIHHYDTLLIFNLPPVDLRWSDRLVYFEKLPWPAWPLSFLLVAWLWE